MMTKRLFHKGQIVICINDDFSWAKRQYQHPGIKYPTFGSRYTVRDYVCGGSHPAIVLMEWTNPKVFYKDGKTREAGFWDQRFVATAPPIKETMREQIEETA